MLNYIGIIISMYAIVLSFMAPRGDFSRNMVIKVIPISLSVFFILTKFKTLGYINISLVLMDWRAI